jgi:carboxypeptidase family protein
VPLHDDGGESERRTKCRETSRDQEVGGASHGAYLIDGARVDNRSTPLHTRRVFHGRRLAFSLVGAIALATATAAASVAPALTSSLSGMTKDELGHALSGVEVVVLANTPDGGARGRVVSDAQGRFLIAALAPGVYRIAAIKPGYLASIGRVNTLVRGSIDVILRPIPSPGEAGAEKVAPDLSWVLRLPPRSILQELGAVSALDEHESGGVRALAARMQDRLTGQVDHVVALGSWRAGGASGDSSLEGAETRMRLGGNIGERGVITVSGARGSLDADAQTSSPSVSRDAANVGVDVSYDTSDDANLAMSAYYARGDLEVGGSADAPKGGRQGQRSWGYDARWQKQVDASSQVAVDVGYHDASLAVDGLTFLDWDQAEDATNRAMAAQGTYEASAADHHVMRFGVRAHRLDQSSPDVRFARAIGPGFADGTSGWSVLLDGEDRWSPGGPVAVAYGLAVRQGIDGPWGTTVTPRVAATWSGRRLTARGELSYLSEFGTEAAAVSPLGYDVRIEAPLGRTVRGIASASYVPLLADRWSGAPGMDAGVFLTDGRASDQVVSLGFERTAPSATISFQIARGRAEGALAPAIDDGLPFVILAERVMEYDAARLGTRLARSGSSIAVEYRALQEGALLPGGVPAATQFRTVAVEFSQDLVRLGGGRATCRLLLAARTAFDVEDASAGGVTPGEARRFAALQQRVNAGISLAF